METELSVNFKQRLQNDDVYVSNRLVSLATLTGLPVRKGLEKALVSNGQVVNVVSKSYGHLPNERFFHEVEVKLVEAGIGYITRSINRDDRSFAVDYILDDDDWVVKVKNGQDKLRPMLRFINSYDGSEKTSGYFGFFREVCRNGLHVAHSKIGFSVKHRGNITQVVLPEIRILVDAFLNNEFYSLHRKFEVLAERPIKNLHDFVKVTAETFKLFQFECSQKNPAPSLNARIVMNEIVREIQMSGHKPNLWTGYNAFNSILHTKLKKSFQAQKSLDEKIFTHLLEMK
ncbi:MAG: DUF932 domain-containing protein [Bacteroidota bacterium]